MLPFEAPVLLPPNNPLVQHHEYFDKWKTLHRDAFTDEEGMDADELVIKVARRCKVFLHPDKWPSDLNDDQHFLLQAIWDTLSGSELFQSSSPAVDQILDTVEVKKLDDNLLDKYD